MKRITFLTSSVQYKNILTIIFNEIKYHVKTSSGLVGGMHPLHTHPCIRTWSHSAMSSFQSVCCETRICFCYHCAVLWPNGLRALLQVNCVVLIAFVFSVWSDDSLSSYSGVAHSL